MSIRLRVLEHLTPEEHNLAAQELAAPAKEAMRRCTATTWDGSEQQSAHAPPAPGATGRWISAMADCSAAVGPVIAFQLGVMAVGPMLARRAFV